MPSLCCQTPGLPSWDYALPRRIARSTGSASWVPRPLLVLSGSRDGLSVIASPGPSTRSLRTSRSFRRCETPPSRKTAALRPRSCAPCRVLPPRSPRASVTVATGPERARCLPGFRPLQHLRNGTSTRMARACHTRYAPSPGFLTLLTVFSAPSPPGLFHPGGAHGVLPFRAFPSRGAVAPLGARCPLDVSAGQPVPPGTVRHRRASIHGRTRRSAEGSDGSWSGPPSGPCSPRESVAIRRWFRPPAARCSPGLPPLQGPHSRRHARRLTPDSSPGLLARVLPPAEAAGSPHAMPSGV